MLVGREWEVRQCSIRTPLVGRPHKSANETHDHRDFAHQQDIQDGRGGQARSQQQRRQQQGRGDEVVNVADVEDLAQVAGHFGITALELDLDGRPAQVGTLGEVGNGGDEESRGKDVVEQTVGAGLCERQAHDDEHGEGHHGADREVPVTTTGRDVVVRGDGVREAIDFESLVTHFDGGGVELLVRGDLE